MRITLYLFYVDCDLACWKGGSLFHSSSCLLSQQEPAYDFLALVLAFGWQGLLPHLLCALDGSDVLYSRMVFPYQYYVEEIPF